MSKHGHDEEGNLLSSPRTVPRIGKQKRSIPDEVFVSRNQARFGIRHAGLLVTALAFDTERQARKWAKWNYRGRASWQVEPLDVGNQSTAGKK